MIRVQKFKSIVIFNIYMKESIRNFAKVANYIADDVRKISLKYFKKKSYAPIVSDSKIRWVYLKDNPLKLDVVAYKGYEDPKEIMDFIKEYIDYDKMYEQAMTKKLNMFYGALDWDEPQIQDENAWF